jgi:endonuclease/exonuclease/phosphatase family metal-dependent hydrolase
MKKKLAVVLLVTFLFSIIALIPKGFSQWNIKLDYLVDSSGKSIEINLTAPVYITSVPLEVYDGNGSIILQREIGQYFTKRNENTRFNRFILNLPLPESMPVELVLFPGSTMERSYTLSNPEVKIDLKNKKVQAYLPREVSIYLSVVNGDTNAEYSLVSAQDGWHSIDISSLPHQLTQPGTALYSTVTFPGGLSTTVTGYMPQVFVDAGIGYTNIEGKSAGGQIPRISILDSDGKLKYTAGQAVQFKEGKFLFQESFEGSRKEIRDGDRLVYSEDGYSFAFDIPYFFASYNEKDNTISGTVSRRGKVVFRIASQSLEAVPDEKGRFSIALMQPIDINRLINVRGGYVSPSGNEYWKMFDWGHIFKASPLYKGAEFDIKVMSYNINHGISRDGKLDIDAAAEVIKESGAQIIGLQEVDSRFVRSLFKDQAKELADKLDMYYYFGENISLLGAGYGNAVLSKFPIITASNLQLDSKGEQRGVVSARIDIYGKEVNFLVTHLSLNRSIRDTQLQQIRRYIRLLEEEVILVGDFNSIPEAGEIMYIERILREAGKELDKEGMYTFVMRDGTPVRIDYIFLSSDIAVSDIYTIYSDASDHLPIVGDIRIKDI